MPRFVLACAAALLVGGLTLAVPSSAATTRQAPKAPTALAVFEQGRDVQLRWHNHADGTAVVRIAHGTNAPATPHDGIAVKHGAAEATLTGLPRNRRYAVAIWTRSKGTLSRRATTTFTTLAKPSNGHRLSGTITDTDGHPLSGVVISIENYSIGTTRTVTTNAEGRYQTNVPDAQYLLTVDGTHAHGGTADATEYQSRVKIITVNAKPRAYNTKLHAGGVVTGRVTDTDGRPLRGVQVTAQAVQPYVPDSSLTLIFPDLGVPPTTSAAGGTYRLAGLGRHDAFRVCFSTQHSKVSGGSAIAYAARCSDTVYPVSPRHTRAVGDTAIDAAPGGAVAGAITGFDGTAARNAAVYLRNDANYVDGTTDAHGHYYLAGVPAGSYEFCATWHAPSRTSYAPKCHTVSIADGAMTKRNLTSPAGSEVSGRVLGPSGRPAVGVVVRVRKLHTHGGPVGAYAITDEHGDFTAGNLPAGSYVACFKTSGAQGPSAHSACYGHRRHFAVPAAQHRIGIDVDLARAGVLTGTVTDAAGHPMANIEVDAENRAAPFADGGFTQTGEQGRYRLVGLAGGKYRVCFESFAFPGADHETCKKVAVTAGRSTNLDAHLPTGATLTVTARDADGRPITGVDVALLAKCTRNDDCEHEPVFSKSQRVAVRSSWASDGNGTVAFHDLDPGTYAVCLFGYNGSTGTHTPPTGYADGCTGTKRTITLGKHAHRSISKTLGVAGVVSGKITDGAGNPLGGVRVHVSGSAAYNYRTFFDNFDGSFGVDNEGPRSDAVTRADGTYSVRSVVPGDQTACFIAGDAAGGSSTTGYLDQCRGGRPGSTSGAKKIGVTTGETTGGVDLALSDAAAVTGTVTNAIGQPLRGAGVAVSQPGTNNDAEVSTGKRGHYLITGLVPAKVNVCAYDFHTGSVKCKKGVTLTSGTTTVVDLSIAGGPSVRPSMFARAAGIRSARQQCMSTVVVRDGQVLSASWRADVRSRSGRLFSGWSPASSFTRSSGTCSTS